MRATRVLIGVVVAAAMMATTAAHAAGLKGVALVIGEWSYSALPRLANPENDARGMDNLLDGLGFEVTRVLDGDGEELRRKIARFEEDAARADVALIYYSGHGFEAGGDNYIVPVDAELSTPASAGASVIPVADLLDRLARDVPVTIVLLDACRTNLFPAGFSIKPPGATQPVPVAPAGLGAIRGPTPIGRAGVPSSSLGMVIGFAAAPGAPALDGGPGEKNSPYAAALIKHLGAGGYSFGDLMSMVSEEVYLNTGARQLPWVSSSLRRVLTFGHAEPDAGVDVDEAAIRTGRRELLLSIATAAPATRTYIETVARSERVPLDALFGMLEVLGVKTSDPAELERKIAEGTARLKVLLAAQPVAVSDDAEIKRLSELAGRAEGEGAIGPALAFRNRASARADAISAQLDASAAPQRLALAATYAANGNTSLLAFDYETAAARFAQAFAEARDADHAAALGYLRAQADALQTLGENGGKAADLERAIATYRAGLTLTSAETDPDAWGALLNGLGRTLRILGERESDSAHLLESVDVLNRALTVRTKDRAPLDWATSQNNLGAALMRLADRDKGTERLHEAIAAYRAALAVRTRETTPQDWVVTMNNLGVALQRLGDRDKESTAHLGEAVETFREALDATPREGAPYTWARWKQNLGVALLSLGRRTKDRATIAEALGAFDEALGVLERERVPLDWARATVNRGGALQSLGEAEAGDESLLAAERAERAALEVYTPKATPLDWANAASDLAWTLKLLGERARSRAMLEEALTLMQSAHEVYQDSGRPLDGWFAPRIAAIEAAITTLG